jgi:hypothetical protein
MTSLRWHRSIYVEICIKCLINSVARKGIAVNNHSNMISNSAQQQNWELTYSLYHALLLQRLCLFRGRRESGLL